MKSLFFLSVLAILYIYLGYPACAYMLALMIRKDVKKKSIQPHVTILIAAYNEEEHIADTIKNKLELEYPKEKLEILVISDGSTDRTDEIVKEFEARRVRLLRQESRAGKTSALNMAVQEARGEILVFSDANSIYAKDALQKLVRNFADPSVGYVTGKMIYTNPDGSPIGDGCTTYMKYENFLREIETQIGSIVGVDGGIDAVRKKLYRPMNPDQLPDFVLPLMVVDQGYRVVYEPEAILMEPALKESADEYRMRVRVSLRALWALWDMRHLLIPSLFRRLLPKIRRKGYQAQSNNQSNPNNPNSPINPSNPTNSNNPNRSNKSKFKIQNSKLGEAFPASQHSSILTASLPSSLAAKQSGLFSWQLFSHKLLRYLAFIFLIIAYLANLKLWSVAPTYKILFIAQNIFYGAAIAAPIIENYGHKSKLLYLANYFTLLNLASAHAFIKFLLHQKMVTWEPRKG